jgi:hypothetical protein
MLASSFGYTRLSETGRRASSVRSLGTVGKGNTNRVASWRTMILSTSLFGSEAVSDRHRVRQVCATGLAGWSAPRL